MTNAKPYRRTSLTTRLLIATLALVSLPAFATSATTPTTALGTTTTYGLTTSSGLVQTSTVHTSAPFFGNEAGPPPGVLSPGLVNTGTRYDRYCLVGKHVCIDYRALEWG